MSILKTRYLWAFLFALGSLSSQAARDTSFNTFLNSSPYTMAVANLLPLPLSISGCVIAYRGGGNPAQDWTMQSDSAFELYSGSDGPLNITMGFDGVDGTTPFSSGNQSLVMDGNSVGCTPGNMAYLQVAVDQSNWFNLPSGLYSGGFTFDICQIRNNGSCRTNANLNDSVTVTFEVDIPDMVQLVVDDAALGGTFAQGGGDITDSSELCIYTNTGGYTLSATATPPKPLDNSAFVMQGVNGEYLDYDVRLSSTVGGTGSLVSQGGSIQATSVAPSSCASALVNNARVLIEVSAQDMDAVQADTYTSDLVLTVEPL